MWVTRDVRHGPGVVLGSFLGLFWNRFGIVLELFWDRFEFVLGSFWDRFWAVLGSFRDRFGMVLGSGWDRFGVGVGGGWGVKNLLFLTRAPTRGHLYFGSLLEPQGF